ncbi:MAG TPA: lipopolysaccharide biosynthesis protein [Candidatus Limnocylindria bacterium]|nr:lipopolysaccharide biosynthesis protein [Candidatus Limnocylindria bacterium]
MSVVVEQPPDVAVPRPSMSLRHVSRHWLVYGLGSVANRLAGFLLLPLYTRYLTPEDYGIKAMVVAGVDIVGIFLSFGLRTAMIRFASDGEGGGVRREAVSTALALFVAVLGTGVSLAVWQSEALAALIFGNAAYAPFLRLGLLTLLFINVFDACMAHLQLRQRSGVYSAISLSTVAVGVALNMVLVVGAGMGVRGLLYGELITYTLFCAALLVYTLREVGITVSPALARRILRYGAPLLFTPLVWTLINQADRIFLTRHVSLGEVGIYSMAIQFSAVLYIAVIQPFTNFWEPAQYQIMREPDAERVIDRIFHLVMSILLVAAFAGALIVDDVIRLMTAPPFWAAAGLVPVFMLAHVTLTLCLFIDTGLFVRNWTGTVAAVAAATACLNIAANAVLVPIAGTTGAAGARLLTAVGMVALSWLAARRAWRVPINVWPLARATAVAIGLFVASTYIPRESLLLALLVKAMLLAGLVAVVLRPSDRARAREMARDVQVRWASKGVGTV